MLSFSIPDKRIHRSNSTMIGLSIVGHVGLYPIENQPITEVNSSLFIFYILYYHDGFNISRFDQVWCQCILVHHNAPSLYFSDEFSVCAWHLYFVSVSYLCFFWVLFRKVIIVVFLQSIIKRGVPVSSTFSNDSFRVVTARLSAWIKCFFRYPIGWLLV